jgi:hypothetical protein
MYPAGVWRDKKRLSAGKVTMLGVVHSNPSALGALYDIEAECYRACNE